jgi:hypothetical protein
VANSRPEAGHEDIEVLTAAYHAGGFPQLRRGFRPAAFAALVKDDDGLMADILDL